MSEFTNYKKYNRKYTRKIKLIYFLAFFVILLSGIVLFFVSQKLLYVLILVLSETVFLFLLALMRRTDDEYISNIILDISKLLDSLLLLERKEVFPRDEDSLVSKLQDRMIKIEHALQKQNEMERMEHENIKALVSDLSHQIKTPLATLKMYVNFLEQDDREESQRKEYIEIINSSLKRLLLLSEGMIKISKLESGLISIQNEQASINKTILTALKDIYPKALEAGIEIEYLENYSGECMHDPKWMAEAIFNLLDNAVKYGKNGNIIIVSVRKLGFSVEIAVEDENTQIERNEYNALFQRFYRGTNSKMIEGSGIGLYLAREIVSRQGGSLSVTKGAIGNKFYIIIPTGS